MEGQRLLEELKKTVDALQAFSEIGKALTSTLDIKEVLRIVLQRVSELLKPSSWSLLLLDEKTQLLRYEILINEPTIDRSTTIRVGAGPVGWVAEQAMPILWPNQKDKKSNSHPGVTSDSSVKSFLSVPLKSKGKVLGVIELRRRGPESEMFNESDLNTLSIISDYAAIAIENGRNFQKIQELTITDDLTSLFNVRHMHTLLDSELLRAKRYRKLLSLIFLDLDHFKEVNDTWGHIHGSQLLKETAEILAEGIRSVDYAARYGGDEFVVLLPETGKKEATMIAERLRAAIEKNSFLNSRGLDVHFTASFGLATFPDDAQTKEELIAKADKAMYSVKNTTRNRVESS